MSTLPAEMLPRVVSVISLVSQGHTLSYACDLAGIAYATFRKYVLQDDQLKEMFGEAEQRSYDMMADALLHIGTHHIYGDADPKMAAIVSKNIQWYLSRRRPTAYGAKVIHEHTITADKEVINALTRAKQRAQGEVPLALEAPVVREQVVDVEYEELEDEAAYSDVTSLTDLF